MDVRANVAGIISDIYAEIGARNPEFRTKYGDSTYTCPGLLFSVQFTARHGDVEIHKYLHLLLAGNAVHVWCAVSDDWSPWSTPWDKWDNVTNHDSCWRSSGVDDSVTHLYFQLCKDVQEGVAEEDKVAPRAVDVTTRLGFLRPFIWVDAKFESTSDTRGRMGRFALVDVSQIRGTYTPSAK